MTIAWTKELSVGNRVIDSAHKEVLHTINKIAHSMAARDVAALVELFDLLESCLYACFAVEEDVAQALDFDFAEHKLSHHSLSSRVQSVKGELLAKNGMWSKSEGKGYINSLMGCLVRHIKEDGKPFRAVLDTHFYDFKPNCASNV